MIKLRNGREEYRVDGSLITEYTFPPENAAIVREEIAARFTGDETPVMNSLGDGSLAVRFPSNSRCVEFESLLDGPILQRLAAVSEKKNGV